MTIVPLSAVLYKVNFLKYVTTIKNIQEIKIDHQFIDYRLLMAFGKVFKECSHTFKVCGILQMLAIQVLSLGVLSLQNKRYFEELFHIKTKL